jgi:hypothetical protein
VRWGSGSVARDSWRLGFLAHEDQANTFWTRAAHSHGLSKDRYPNPILAPCSMCYSFFLYGKPLSLFSPTYFVGLSTSLTKTNFDSIYFLVGWWSEWSNIYPQEDLQYMYYITKVNLLTPALMGRLNFQKSLNETKIKRVVLRQRKMCGVNIDYCYNLGLWSMGCSMEWL